MTKSDKPTSAPRLTPFERGYHPKPLKEGYTPNLNNGHQPTTSQRAPDKPPSNPPNQGTGGKSD